jgi:LL-diaminopimelate aminotransferase
MTPVMARRIEKVNEYYFSTKLKQIEEMNRSGPTVINMGIGSPDLPPSGSVIEKLINSSLKPGNHGYQSYRGVGSLRLAFAEWYSKYYGVDLDPLHEILPLMGSKEGIFYVSMAFLNEGDQVLVPDPGYPTYTSVSELVGAEVIPYDLKAEKGWHPELDRLEKMDLTKVRIMWVNYPHMPTGAKATKALFRELVDFGKSHDIIICHDNPYSFILNEDPLSLLALEESEEMVLELNSLSKSHNMAGWRIGMVAGNQAFINHINTVTSNIQSGMFLPIQHAAIEALGHSRSWYNQLNKIYSERRKRVWQLLDLLHCTYEKEQAGLFVWAGIPGEHDSFAFSEEILERARVFITPGGVFGKNGINYIRVSLCSPVEIILESFNRIKQIIR